MSEKYDPVQDLEAEIERYEKLLKDLKDLRDIARGRATPFFSKGDY